MAPVSGFFQANFSTVLLRSAALAIALIAPGLAQAAPLVLSCESSTDSTAKQFRIDFDNKTVQEINVTLEKNPSGHAEITESSIRWRTVQKLGDAAGGLQDWDVVGSIDRLAGSIRWELSNPRNPHQFQLVTGKCRQATQKF